MSDMTLEALIVDSEKSSARELLEAVRQEGFSARAVHDLAEAREAIRDRMPHVLLCSLGLPDGSGLDLLADLEDVPRVETIVVTANATVKSAVAALRIGAYDYLTKPIDRERLRVLLGHIRRGSALLSNLVTLRRELRQMGRFGSMVGTSPAMQEVFDLIERVAPTDTTVLISGESGTGKEVAAETIHRLSRRIEGPFVPMNCGAVSSQLIESELFGHEKSSFTGAERRHRGVFEQAHRGTLLLDEITEMSQDLQVKLLRVLETGKIRRLGGHERIEVDVRVVAATNRNPWRAVEEEMLREDLFYRLNVFPVVLPTLAERGDDVPMLARYFLEQRSRVAGRVKIFDDEALGVLSDYTWPGNVRELKNVVERAYILADDTISEDCLPEVIRSGSRTRAGRPVAAPGTPLEVVIREHTLATLRHFEGNKTQTAKALGISLKTLYNRLAAYGTHTPNGG